MSYLGSVIPNEVNEWDITKRRLEALERTIPIQQKKINEQDATIESLKVCVEFLREKSSKDTQIQFQYLSDSLGIEDSCCTYNKEKRVKTLFKKIVPQQLKDSESDVGHITETIKVLNEELISCETIFCDFLEQKPEDLYTKSLKSNLFSLCGDLDKLQTTAQTIESNIHTLVSSIGVNSLDENPVLRECRDMLLKKWSQYALERRHLRWRCISLDIAQKFFLEIQKFTIICAVAANQNSNQTINSPFLESSYNLLGYQCGKKIKENLSKSTKEDFKKQIKHSDEGCLNIDKECQLLKNKWNTFVATMEDENPSFPDELVPFVQTHAIKALNQKSYVAIQTDVRKKQVDYHAKIATVWKEFIKSYQKFYVVWMQLKILREKEELSATTALDYTNHPFYGYTPPSIGDEWEKM